MWEHTREDWARDEEHLLRVILSCSHLPLDRRILATERVWHQLDTMRAAKELYFALKEDQKQDELWSIVP